VQGRPTYQRVTVPKERRLSTERKFRLLLNKSCQQCEKASEDLNLKGSTKFQEDVNPH